MWLSLETGKCLVFPKLNRKMQSVPCTSKFPLVFVVPRTVWWIWEWWPHSRGWSHTCLLVCILHFQEVRAIPNPWVQFCAVWFKIPDICVHWYQFFSLINIHGGHWKWMISSNTNPSIIHIIVAFAGNFPLTILPTFVWARFMLLGIRSFLEGGLFSRWSVLKRFHVLPAAVSRIWQGWARALESVWALSICWIFHIILKWFG